MLDDSRPLFCFAGISTEFKGDRGTKSKPVPGPHLVYDFLTTSPNAIVEPIHPKAMLVILTPRRSATSECAPHGMRRRPCSARCRTTRSRSSCEDLKIGPPPSALVGREPGQSMSKPKLPPRDQHQGPSTLAASLPTGRLHHLKPVQPAAAWLPRSRPSNRLPFCTGRRNRWKSCGRGNLESLLCANRPEGRERDKDLSRQERPRC